MRETGAGGNDFFAGFFGFCGEPFIRGCGEDEGGLDFGGEGVSGIESGGDLRTECAGFPGNGIGEGGDADAEFPDVFGGERKGEGSALLRCDRAVEVIERMVRQAGCIRRLLENGGRGLPFFLKQRGLEAV